MLIYAAELLPVSRHIPYPIGNCFQARPRGSKSSSERAYKKATEMPTMRIAKFRSTLVREVAQRRNRALAALEKVSCRCPSVLHSPTQRRLLRSCRHVVSYFSGVADGNSYSAKNSSKSTNGCLSLPSSRLQLCEDQAVLWSNQTLSCHPWADAWIGELVSWHSSLARATSIRRTYLAGRLRWLIWSTWQPLRNSPSPSKFVLAFSASFRDLWTRKCCAPRLTEIFVDSARSRSNRKQSRTQRVSISSAAPQQNKHHADTCSAVLQAGVSSTRTCSAGS